VLRKSSSSTNHGSRLHLNPTRNSKASPSDRHLSVSSHAQNNKCVGNPHFNRPHCGFAFDDRLISRGRAGFLILCLGRCTANPGSVSRLRQTRWGHPPKTKMRRILHHQPPGDRCSTLTLKIHNRDFIHRRHYRLVLSSAPTTPPFTESSESSTLTSLHTEHARIAAVAKLCFHRSSSPSCTAAISHSCISGYSSRPSLRYLCGASKSNHD
jgi:hypothetical protein